jgi:polyhydroxyalkanoate synthase subunit PhaC
MTTISKDEETARQALGQPWSAAKVYADFVGKLSLAWLGQSELEPDPKDRRFADPAWRDNPSYRAWLQTYLAWRDALGGWVESAGLDRKSEQRARFLLSLLTEAAAPTNIFLGNPAASKRCFETGGASAVRGFGHLLEDIVNNRGLPAQVDKQAFKVGENLALSPGVVVFKNEVLELIEYAPETKRTYARPLLMVPPQINKFYVLDLAPGKSLVEYLAKSSLQPFVVSWRNPTSAERDWGLETYLGALLEAIDATCQITGSQDVNLMGACSGGITAAFLLAHLAAWGDRRVNAATFLVSMLDTEAESQLGLFATRETIEAARLASRLTGVLDGQELARVFAWMRPNDLVWSYWVNNYLLGENPPAFDILFWNSDTTRLPAKLHSDFLDLVLTNPLRNPGRLELLGTPIDLSKVEQDTYVMAGVSDHITPWQACYATTQLLGGRCEFVLNSSGHVQSVVNPPGNPKATFLHNPHCPPDPDAWLAGAQQQAGSWWEHWREWLVERSGERKTARKSLGSRRHRPGAKAPGTYVFEP